MNLAFRELKWQLLPGVLAALAIAILLYLQMFQPLEQAAYGTLFRLRGALPWDQRVVVVAIDDASVKQLGRFPWPRQRYVELMSLLTRHQASIVAFDLLWSENSPDDGELAQSLNHHGGVVLAQAWDNTGLPLLPVPELHNAAISTGHIMEREDADGQTRQVALQIQDAPALGIAVLEAYGLVREPISLPPVERFLWINWPGPIRQLQQYSFKDVLQNRIPPERLRHKIVLVGVTALGFDTLLTPFDQQPLASGVHLQAAVLTNLLHGNGLHPVSPRWLGLVLLLGGPGLSVLLTRWPLKQQLFISVGLLVGWGLLSLGLFRFNFWIPVASPMALILVTSGSVFLHERIRVNRLLHRQVRQLWQAYLQKGTFQIITPDATIVARNQPAALQPATQLALLAEQFGYLSQQLAERTQQLEIVNKELEAFSYAVSHDLRAPLRRIDGFSQILLEEYAEQLDGTGQDYLQRIQASSGRMGELIEDLLTLSRITRSQLHRTTFNLSTLAQGIATELQQTQPDRSGEFIIAPNLLVNGDVRLLKVALENLLSNAWKYTSKCDQARIELGLLPSELGEKTKTPIYFVRDNGAGFNMSYADKLFVAFQRLHTTEEFPGTGVGLTTAQRIIHRHGGKIWAEGVVDQGATFYFTLQV
ncbi:hypothetical protein BST81_15610 [Leptolyngbya sp. 'hensonii']|uniref:sensor histidine kinase n=1 Tax=Leptolyngbya sp. 'hensonii' TaxID=1922337 RepID=UPI00094FA797|nr:CHASE2 domain-containing protein [Leptolyngbya sp. 'hensonii']OLP17743.1 hypothetical protein BST81_15610 [Leptolyngbya sp. 'hensonii']